MTDKFLLFYKALQAGSIVELDGQRFAIGEDGNVGVILRKTRSDGTEIELVGRAEYSLNYFMKKCEDLSDEEILNLVFRLGKD